MARYFGTDGFRGEVGVTLNTRHAFDIGRFLGWYHKSMRQQTGQDGRARVLIGKDTRRSCDTLESALAAGVTASGGDAHLLHVTTTASVSYLARAGKFDCAVMISASHNPFWDNGIKLLGAGGEKPDDALLSMIEDYLDGWLIVEDTTLKTLPYAARGEVGQVVDAGALRAMYTAWLTAGAQRLEGMRIGVDCANGSAWQIAADVLRALGAEPYFTGVSPNGENINCACGSTHIEGLCELVKEKQLHVGIAFDGDADRCLMVDEHGQIVDGDGILYIMAKEYVANGGSDCHTVVGTVMSNTGFEKSLNREGIRLLRTPVGDKYVWREMETSGAKLGGEPSGHIIFAEDATTGDGILTALKVLGVMESRGEPLSALVQGMERYPCVTCNFAAQDPTALLASPAVQAAIKNAEEMVAGQGRLLVRASGTEPVLRIMAEAEDATLAATAVDKIRFAAETRER